MFSVYKLIVFFRKDLSNKGSNSIAILITGTIAYTQSVHNVIVK